MCVISMHNVILEFFSYFFPIKFTTLFIMEFHDIINYAVQSDSEIFNLVDAVYDVFNKAHMFTYRSRFASNNRNTNKISLRGDVSCTYDICVHKKKNVWVLCILRSVVENGSEWTSLYIHQPHLHILTEKKTDARNSIGRIETCREENVCTSLVHIYVYNLRFP